jgi:enoyl-CoA hydratase
VAVRTTLKTLRNRMNAGLDTALQREADAQAQTYAASDLSEGLRAIAEKRAPEFGVLVKD